MSLRRYHRRWPSCSRRCCAQGTCGAVRLPTSMHRCSAASAPPLRRLCTASAQPLHCLCTASAPPLPRLCAAPAPPLHRRCTASAPYTAAAQTLHRLCTLSAGTPAPALALALREGGSDAGVVLLLGREAGRGARAGAAVPRGRRRLRLAASRSPVKGLFGLPIWAQRVGHKGLEAHAPAVSTFVCDQTYAVGTMLKAHSWQK